MTRRWTIALGAGLLAAGLASPASAGGARWRDTGCYKCLHHAIYEDFNFIAHLEAVPDFDDGLKGPDITAARAEIHRLHAMIGPAYWRWPVPCCYSRKPLHIR